MTAESQPDLADAIPATQASAVSAPAVAHVDGLRDTLSSLCETLAIVRAQLEHHGKLIKFSWISSRLMVMRNVVVASVIVSATIIGVTFLVREAYRQTLTIVAFDVPRSVSERGITGEVVAKNLFNELVKRRRTITTFDAGELTRLSAERHSDIATTDGKFSLQSAFRYLRHLTGRETTIDGEMLVDGDNITLIARIAGHPQRSAKGPLADWDTLLGELANYVFETTQPVVLAGYLGETARTLADLAELSRLIQRMATAKPSIPDAALAVAYHSYGVALNRQRRGEEAQAAWARARVLDPKLVLPYLSAATALQTSGSAAAADRLFREAENLETSAEARLRTLGRRLTIAENRNDCRSMRKVLDQASSLGGKNDLNWESRGAGYLAACEYQQSRAAAIRRDIALLHPESTIYWYRLAVLSGERPDDRYLVEARDAAARAVAADPAKRNGFVRLNHALYLARLGDVEAAEEAYKAGVELRAAEDRLPRHVLAQIRKAQGNPSEAERLLRVNLAEIGNVSGNDFKLLIEVLAAQGKVDEAAQAMREVQKLFPLYCDGYDVAARVLLKAGRESEAFAQWEAGIRAIPKCDVHYLHYARALIERKRLPEAQRQLEALLKNSRLSDGAAEAKPLLATLANGQ